MNSINTTSLHIHPCNWKHRAVLSELGGTTFYETFRPYHSEADMQAYIEKTYNIRQIAKNLTDPYIRYFVAYDGDVDLGYIKLLDDVKVEGLHGKVMELEKIYVRKPAQGKGVSQALMEKAIELARKEKYDELFLGVWQENKRALAFYKKYGFEVFNTRTFKLGDTLCDDYLLHLSLQP